ncbi:MAG: ATP-dependent zinc protease [SAR324 cluster bacterium]|nr:ATP-dependent zinc protease [SAR324 cluster bacterium]
MAALEKIKVAPGIVWVGIPEADVYVLCGCPADSVKHLIKKRLIVSRETHGVPLETGPNAILLSDTTLQNGSFANLAEFPVLQMLYRQGMIIPNHPNNKGIKPVIMGMADQVDAQMEYIYRGNYGLISEEEICQTGIFKALSAEMMRIKLQFAFGQIRKTEELLEKRYIDDDPVEIRNGVFIKRLGLNIFEFQFQEETTIVDLNLAPNVQYQPPYELACMQIRREYFAVLHTGEGDGWDINRPCMSSILMFQGRLYLIDAGPNILHSLMALGISTNEIEGIFHTHAHDDHFAGLTTLIRTDRRIKYYTTPLVRASVSKKLAALMSMDEKYFEEYFDVHDLQFDVWNNIEGLEVKPLFSPHPVETNIFLFRTLWQAGYPTYAHLADIASLDMLQQMMTAGMTPDCYEQIKSNYLTAVQLKKIDIGGGLIHGKADDFKEDVSSKIILAHTEKKLTNRQKEIGSETNFGMVDVLIPAVQDYTRKQAAEYLANYFPMIPPYELAPLLNCPLVQLNAGSIILKHADHSEEVYLIINGVLELIYPDSECQSFLSSGSLIGELPVLFKIPALGTYRTATVIQMLKIPGTLYQEFVNRNDLYDDIQGIHHKLDFLRKSWLFGENISYPIQTKIAQNMISSEYPEKKQIKSLKKNMLYLLESGEVQLLYHGKVIETLRTSGRIFGEDRILFAHPSPFHFYFAPSTRIYKIPGHVIREIPILLWKLLQIWERRVKLIGDSPLQMNQKGLLKTAKPKKRRPNKPKQIIGRTELIDLPDLGLFGVDAKMDSGAYTSSIHCSSIAIEEQSQGFYVRFKILDESHPNYQQMEFCLPVHNEKRVKSSSGETEDRIFIKTRMSLYGEIFEIELSLTDRSQMKFPILLGRKAFKKRFILDTAKKYIASHSF